MASSSLILESYLQSFGMDELQRKKIVINLIEYNKRSGGYGFLAPLNMYLNILENTDDVLLHYMSKEKKEQRLRDLQVAYLLLLAQKKHELTHQKTENKKIYAQHIEKCRRLLDIQHYKKKCEEEHIEPAPDYGCKSDGNPIKYCFIQLGQWFAEKTVAMLDRGTKTIKEAIAWLNDKRLFWVWESNLFKTIIGMLPADSFHITQAQKIVQFPDPYTGTASWGFYYFLLGLHTFLLLKHTISGPWMSEEEKSIPWYERFLTQWSLRKFAILNYLFWAPGNMVCFFWLVGKGALGSWGDLLTLGLLVFDIAMSVWEFEEELTQFRSEMCEFDKDIALVTEWIKNAKNSEDEASKKQLNDFYMQLDGLERAKKRCQKDWDLKKYGFMNNIGYAVGLMLAFALLTMPFLPISGPLVLALSITGAVLCFVFTVIYNMVKSGIDIYLAHLSQSEIKTNFKIKIAEFKELLAKNPEFDDNEKRFLFLELQQLLAQNEYQQQMIVYKTMHFLRSVMMEALMPAIIFASFVFLPLGFGFGVLGAIVVLAIVSNIVIDKTFNPEKDEVMKFDEKEYQAFCKAPDHWYKKSTKTNALFFKPTERESIDEAREQTLLDLDNDSPMLGSEM